MYLVSDARFRSGEKARSVAASETDRKSSYRYRMRSEEAMLIASFGKEYRSTPDAQSA